MVPRRFPIYFQILIFTNIFMKHVTIAPSPERASPVIQPLDHGVKDGNSLPKHMIPFGQDGYRTPTVEDYEKHEEQFDPSGASNGALSNNSSRYRLPHSPNGILGHNSANASIASSLAERLFEKLEWRERLRHYTWTFFTMTMATGGIANVLYEGKSRKKSYYSMAR